MMTLNAFVLTLNAVYREISLSFIKVPPGIMHYDDNSVLISLPQSHKALNHFMNFV